MMSILYFPPITARVASKGQLHDFKISLSIIYVDSLLYINFPKGKYCTLKCVLDKRKVCVYYTFVLKLLSINLRSYYEFFRVG